MNATNPNSTANVAPISNGPCDGMFALIASEVTNRSKNSAAQANHPIFMPRYRIVSSRRPAANQYSWCGQIHHVGGEHRNQLRNDKPGNKRDAHHRDHSHEQRFLTLPVGHFTVRTEVRCHARWQQRISSHPIKHSNRQQKSVNYSWNAQIVHRCLFPSAYSSRPRATILLRQAVLTKFLPFSVECPKLECIQQIHSQS